MFVVYETASGRAVSYGSLVADPLPAGLASVDVGSAGFSTHEWDAITRTMVLLPQRTTTFVARRVFLRRIPRAVRQSIEELLEGTSTTAGAIARRARIRDFYRLVMSEDTVDVTDPDIITYVGDMVTAGLLTQVQADAVLAPVVVAS